MTNIKKITVAGGGVLGSQIAYQAAYCGFDVTIWLRSKSSIDRCKPKLDDLKKTYIEALNLMADPIQKEANWCPGLASPDDFDLKKSLEKIANINIKLELDMAKAFKDVDLVIESMAENVDDKIKFYTAIVPYLDEKTIIVTNSSTLLPSTFAKYTGRPDKYLSMHFANSIWKNNIVEIMMQEKTSKEYFDLIVAFANEIRMLALPVLKEKKGYLLNSMLVPFLLSGLDLYANGISDPRSIDLAWTKGTGAPKGPFEIFDTVGLTTALNIVNQYQKVPGLLKPLLAKMMMPYNFKGMKEILEKYIAQGKLGKSTGEGFYKYK